MLLKRQAIVMGPTPPGTGVMAPATLTASAKATSPTSRLLPAAPVARFDPGPRIEDALAALMADLR